MGAQPQPQPGPAQPPGQVLPPTPPEMGAQPAPAPQGTEQPQVTTGGESERQLCDKLITVSKLHVEDVPKGVAIVIEPKSGQDMSTVRDDARRTENLIKQHATPESAPAPGEACGIFAIARLPGVTTQLAEGAKSVRIVMLTKNPAELKDLRRSAREQVNAMPKR
jgi:hypothetical protein